jgi:curli production assembly/transport component CsgG
MAEIKMKKRGRFGMELVGGATYMAGGIRPGSQANVKRGSQIFFDSKFFISASTNVFLLGNKNKLDVGYALLDLNLEYLIASLRCIDTLLFFAGTGTVSIQIIRNLHTKIQYGAGLEANNQ